MKVPRTLLAFAYVADQFAKTNDIASGLAPLFAPIIASREGKTFEPTQFANDVLATYDIRMHPYVAEELAPGLAKAGYLEVVRNQNSHVVRYVNKNCAVASPAVEEQKLVHLIDAFVAFANEHLGKLTTKIDRNSLEAALLDRLIHPAFLGLLLRPDRPLRQERTLGLSPKVPINAGDDEAAIEGHLDYLVAQFILLMYQQQGEEFELLVSATTGALVAEVVLDLQKPPAIGVPLQGVRVAIDSPLILDALGLGLDETVPFAKELIDQIRTSGATPVIFDGTVSEIVGAIRAPLELFERGQEVFGPLGRRLRSSSVVAAYLRALIPKIEEEI
jgi:hypothetical protein